MCDIVQCCDILCVFSIVSTSIFTSCLLTLVVHLVMLSIDIELRSPAGSVEWQLIG